MGLAYFAATESARRLLAQAAEMAAVDERPDDQVSVNTIFRDTLEPEFGPEAGGKRSGAPICKLKSTVKRQQWAFASGDLHGVPLKYVHSGSTASSFNQGRAYSHEHRAALA